MSKKLTILAAAYGQSSPFTVADLAEKAGVSASTVQTVLNRVPEDWFVKTQLQSGARGGQPNGYTLSEVGRRAVEHTLEKVNVMPRLAPEQPPFEVPLGLLSAQATLRELASAPSAAREGLREDALGNLKWAESEVRDGTFATHAADLLKQIAELREQLGEGVRMAPHHSIEAAVTFFPTQEPVEESFLSIAKRRLEYWRDAVVKRVGIGSPLSPERPVFVVIGYLDGNEGSRELATFARGALSGAAQCARLEQGTNFNLVMHPFGAGPSWGSVDPTWPEDINEASEIFLCVNSSTDVKAVKRALRCVKDVSTQKAAVLLDDSFSPQVESYARELDIAYEANATQGRMAWIGQAISGA